MVENWKKHPIYDRYEVSDMGRVRSLYHKGKLRKKPYIMSPGRVNNGYLQITLYDGEGNHKTYLVHRLVMETFNPTNLKMIVHHKNHITSDNRLSNLEWVTYKMNNEPHIYDRCRESKSKKVGQYDLNGVLIKEWYCATDAERDTDGYYKKRSISQVCNGEKRSHRGYIWKFI